MKRLSDALILIVSALAVFRNLSELFSPSRTIVVSHYAAYVDPGTGILAWQLIAAAAAGLLFSVRKQVRRAGTWVRFQWTTAKGRWTGSRRV